MSIFGDPHLIDVRLDSRAVSFENPTGARGRGGTAHGGRKGAPSRTIAPGERVVLADLDGPGTLRHVWFAISPAPPEAQRAQVLEVFYEGNAAPSVSVPVFDYFALPHGRAAVVNSALVSVQEGRGLNSYVPVPFDGHVRVEYVNGSTRPMTIYYQIDYTLEPTRDERAGFLHASFRRQNPTVLRDDFVIVEGIRGPGRFLGCAVGVRVLDEGMWYGEGEVKIYRDGDLTNPTICGTGLEDYACSAWGLGAHSHLYAGAPLDVREPGPAEAGIGLDPRTARFVGFYRWHLPDPVVFADDLRVTIQQIGAAMFPTTAVDERERYEQTHPVAGAGWNDLGPVTIGIVERVDDYCATAFVYATTPQPVPRVDIASAVADVERLSFEAVDPLEAFSAAAGGLASDRPPG